MVILYVLITTLPWITVYFNLQVKYGCLWATEFTNRYTFSSVFVHFNITLDNIVH